MHAIMSPALAPAVYCTQRRRDVISKAESRMVEPLRLVSWALTVV
jgi:hypothetical protein